MTGEMEAAAADSVGELFKRRGKHPFTGRGQPCANCGAALAGPYCHECGQNADNHKRSIGHLIIEAIEGMFHLDGRLALTLPALFFRPGTLAKDYMEGRIVRHVPPFRTFLVALLLFIFAAEHAIHSAQHHAEAETHRRAQALATPQGRAVEAGRLRVEAVKARDERLKEAAGERDASLIEAAQDRDEALKDPDEDHAKALKAYQDAAAKAPADYQKAVAGAEAAYADALAQADHLRNNPLAAQEALEAEEKARKSTAQAIRSARITHTFDEGAIEARAAELARQPAETTTLAGVTIKTPKALPEGALAGAEQTIRPGEQPNPGPGLWIRNGLAKALENPEYYLVVMSGWGHRLAVLLLPMLGLSLTLVYLNKRQFFVYDHLIVATNLLSFAFLTNAFGLVLPGPARTWWFVLLAVWTPINLFQTLRGAYGSSVPGAIIKTLVVWWSTVFSFVLLLGVLMLFALAQI